MFFNTEESQDEEKNKDDDEDLRKQLLSQPIYLYCTYLSSCYYDKARDIADKEKETLRHNPSNINHILFSVLSHLAVAEKQYMTFGYLAPKRFLMKETSLCSQYGHLYSELTKLDDRISSSQNEDEVLVVAAQIKNFIKVRIGLVDFFERISTSAVKASSSLSSAGSSAVLNRTESNSSTFTTSETIVMPDLDEIFYSYGSALDHQLLNPLTKSFVFELDSLRTLFTAHNEIRQWRFYEALQALDEARISLAKWHEVLTASVRGADSFFSPSKTTFFGSFMGLRSPSGRTSSSEKAELCLYEWMSKLRSTLHSKFTLYFYEVLLAQITLSDMKEKCTKLYIDYPSKFAAFQKRIEATAITLVFDATPDKVKYKGPGFHHSEKRLANQLQGLDLYPSPFTCPIVGTNGSCIPQDEVARHWPCVVKIINDNARDLDLMDKVVYVHDARLENTYFMMRIEPRMTMVIIFERLKHEKDPLVSDFLTEVAALLRCTKLFASLRAVQK